MFERSADAPTYWGQSDVEAAVRETVLDVEPDVVTFQELPGLVPYVETHDMVRSNPRSHSGNLATLVSHALMDPEPGSIGLTRTGILTTFAAHDLTIANVHLAPGRGSADMRRRQLEAVLDTSPTERLVVVGDTNTRVDEEPAFTELGFAAPRPPGPTWDGHRNRFRGESGRFRAYFTRAFTAGSLRIAGQRVLDEPREVDGQQFHVSDHFPLLLTVEW